MYAQDHDEVLPPADKWQDEIWPYLKNEQLFRCPAAPQLECGYAFNATLSKKPLGAIDDPAGTILFTESDQAGRNIAVDPAEKPNPARHNGGTNVAYTDGHCKWLAGPPPPPPPAQ